MKRSARTSFRNTRGHHPSELMARVGVAIVLFTLLALFRSTIYVRSASVTPGARDALSIRGGVVTIAPGGSADSIMELGNEGNQIASSGAIYFRPNSTAAGSRLVGSGPAHNLTMTGNVTVDGAISLGGVSYESWPDADGWMIKNYSGGDYLVPIDASTTVQTGAVATVPAVSIYELSSLTGLRVNNAGSGPAATFNNTTVTIRDILRITSSDPSDPPLTVGGNKVWYAGNDGADSGLDADLLDGNDTYFAPNCAGQAADVLCLCVRTNSQNHCTMTEVKSYDLR